jgi:hypothetical protein
MATRNIAPADLQLFNKAFSLANKYQWLRRDSFNNGLLTLVQEAEATTFPAVLERLLAKFVFIDSEEAERLTILIADQILAISPQPENVGVFAIQDRLDPDGSEVILNSLKPRLGRQWKSRLFNRLDQALIPPHFSNIVIVDDFVGTGDKATKAITKLRTFFQQNQITQPKIFFACYAGMLAGIKLLEASVGADAVIPGTVLTRGISDQFSGMERAEIHNAMIEIEQQLLPMLSVINSSKSQNRKPTYHFGYGQSEALIWLENFNIPNNVFPYFWKDQYLSKIAGKPVQRQPLFVRA